MVESIRAAGFSKTWLILLALVIIVSAANLWKPYHIDDTAHLAIANWIAENPFRPMSGMLNWSGVDEPIHRTNQPHLFFYIMAAWGSLFGWDEPVQHILIMIGSAASIFLMYRLSNRIIPEHSLWATAVLALSPAFVVSQNMMVDVPLLATWLWFFHSLIHAPSEERRVAPYISASLALSFGILIKYSSIVLFPVLLIVILMDRRWLIVLVLSIPTIVLVCWSVFNLSDYGGIHILERSAGSEDLLKPLKNSLAWVLIIGAITPLGFLLMAYSPYFRRWAVALLYGTSAVTAITTIMVATTYLTEYSADWILWAIFLLSGLAVFALTLYSLPFVITRLYQQESVGGEDRIVLILWIWVMGTSAFYVLISQFMAVRHVLLILPAIIVLSSLAIRTVVSRRAKWMTVAVSAGLASLLAISDFRFAAFYKSEASDIAGYLPNSGTVWTSGHWGWQWYARQEGFRQIDYESSRPQPGDYFIEAVGVDRQFSKDTLDLELVRSHVQTDILTNFFCTARSARFYYSTARVGPWSLSRDCNQRIDVYRVL